MTASPPSQATVLTVLNLKGGVGKTHTAWLLASVSHERGKRLLAVDTDPQGNLSNSLARDRGNAAGVERLRGMGNKRSGVGAGSIVGRQ